MRRTVQHIGSVALSSHRHLHNKCGGGSYFRRPSRTYAAASASSSSSIPPVRPTPRVRQQPMTPSTILTDPHSTSQWPTQDHPVSSSGNLVQPKPKVANRVNGDASSSSSLLSFPQNTSESPATSIPIITPQAGASRPTPKGKQTDKNGDDAETPLPSLKKIGQNASAAASKEMEPRDVMNKMEQYFDEYDEAVSAATKSAQRVEAFKPVNLASLGKPASGVELSNESSTEPASQEGRPQSAVPSSANSPEEKVKPTPKTRAVEGGEAAATSQSEAERETQSPQAQIMASQENDNNKPTPQPSPPPSSSSNGHAHIPIPKVRPQAAAESELESRERMERLSTCTGQSPSNSSITHKPAPKTRKSAEPKVEAQAQAVMAKMEAYCDEAEEATHETSAKEDSPVGAMAAAEAFTPKPKMQPPMTFEAVLKSGGAEAADAELELEYLRPIETQQDSCSLLPASTVQRIEKEALDAQRKKQEELQKDLERQQLLEELKTRLISLHKQLESALETHRRADESVYEVAEELELAMEKMAMLGLGESVITPSPWHRTGARAQRGHLAAGASVYNWENFVRVLKVIRSSPILILHMVLPWIPFLIFFAMWQFKELREEFEAEMEWQQMIASGQGVAKPLTTTQVVIGWIKVPFRPLIWVASQLF